MISLGSTRILEKIVNTIVDSVHPQKIILFGSRAREDHNERSDYDVMVIKQGLNNERKISRRIYKTLFEKKIRKAVDIIVVDRDKFQIQKENPYLIYSWRSKKERFSMAKEDEENK